MKKLRKNKILSLDNKKIDEIRDKIEDHIDFFENP